jgi:hypothetical protein
MIGSNMLCVEGAIGVGEGVFELEVNAKAREVSLGVGDVPTFNVRLKHPTTVSR